MTQKKNKRKQTNIYLPTIEFLKIQILSNNIFIYNMERKSLLMADTTSQEHIMLKEEKILRLLKFLKNGRVMINLMIKENCLKRITIVLHLLLYFITPCALMAQTSLHEQAQAILLQGAHINHFNRQCPQEKVYLHFDNTAYFQGETIWFSAIADSFGRIIGAF